MLAASGPGVGASAAVGLLVPMEAGVPIPVPADFLMLLVGERVAAGHFPLWAAVAGFEAVALVGTAALFFACRGPGHAVIHRLGPRAGLTRRRRHGQGTGPGRLRRTRRAGRRVLAPPAGAAPGRPGLDRGQLPRLPGPQRRRGAGERSRAPSERTLRRVRSLSPVDDK